MPYNTTTNRTSITLQKLAKTTLILVIFAILFIRPFFYFDFKHGCKITIYPSLTEYSAPKIVKRALRILKKVSPPDYQDVCDRVSVINPNISCAGFGGGCFINTPTLSRTIDISTSQRSLAWTVGVIVHETCHAKQGYEKRSFDENECYLEDDRIINDIVEL